MRAFYTLLFCAFAFLSFGQSISLKRGPYLNTATQSGITIRFRTDLPCQAMVEVKDENTNETISFLEESVSDSDHVVNIEGLSIQSKYYYQCFCDNTPLTDKTDNDFYFKTLPEDDYDGPINIWAIGDFGTGNQDQRNVRDAYLNYMKRNNWETDVWLMLGDYAYGDGTDHEYQVNNFDIYGNEYKYMTAWPAPGNHDYKSVDIITHDGPYYEIYTMPTQGESGGLASGSEYYYSFDYGNVHFISLNSEWSPWIYVPVASPMVLWMLADMQQTDKTWKIAYWHQPPYSKGSHDSDDPFGIMNMFRQNILPFLELGGCDLALQGHSHCYERSYLITGHYGYSSLYSPDRHAISTKSGNPDLGETYYKAKSGLNAGRGTIYNVVGNSGKVSESGSMDHPVMYYNDNLNKGSTSIRVHGDTLTGVYISDKGDILDKYRIIKNEDGEPGNNTAVNEIDTDKQNLSLRIKNENGNVWLCFELSNPEKVSLELYDINGKLISTFLKDNNMNKGARMYRVPDHISTGDYLGVLKVGKQRVTTAFHYQK